MPQSVDLFFYVQHLLGIGHLKRAERLAEAAAKAGLTVAFVTGGVLGEAPQAIRGITRYQLSPALKTRDENFSELIDEEGRALDEAGRTARRDRLLQLLHDLRPRALLLEMFPFGRRQMRFELEPLLEAAHRMQPRPFVLSSVRDILTTTKQPGKVEWVVERLKRWFDFVLVHGDQKLVDFAQTFPAAEQVAEQLYYTGYVTGQAAIKPASGEKREVLVSTGGGAVAEGLVRAALAARALTSLKEAPWRVLIGHNLPEKPFQDLKAAAPQGVVVERSRGDFLSLLAGARLSISQAGYNTTLEVLAAGVPAVVVPFAAGSETEQTLRAELLAKAGRLVVVKEASLSPQSLAEGIERALKFSPPPLQLDLAGAEKSAQFLLRLLQKSGAAC